MAPTVTTFRIAYADRRGDIYDLSPHVITRYTYLARPRYAHNFTNDLACQESQVLYGWTVTK